MSDPTPDPVPARGPAVRLAAGLLALSAVGAAAGWGWGDRRPAPRSEPPAADDRTPGSGATAAPAPRFAVTAYPTWAGKPDVVLAVTGQTHGYQSPCGCSLPQTGGLERRANLFARVRDKLGAPVVGLDLGDVVAKEGLAVQNRIKYRTTMQTLAALGYAAVGLGEDDFSQQLVPLLAEYPLQNPGKPPVLLAANLVGANRDAAGKVTQVTPREAAFPGGAPGDRPMVEGVEVVTPPGGPAVGVVGVIGPAVADKAVRLDGTVEVLPRSPADGKVRTAGVVQDALDKLAAHPARPQLLVLLYQGNLDEARQAAAAFPQFPLVVCLSDESEPPQFPAPANNGATRIIQVGHKGKNVGLVGATRTPAGGWEFQYHLVPLTEEYVSPPGPAADAANPALVLLEKYAAEVRDRDMLGKARVRPLPHPAQIGGPSGQLSYVGAKACQKCHAAEYAIWSGTRHSHAYESLEQAKRPALRQYDPECVKCHTTGFEYAGGFENEKRTAHLVGNQCENCHGPGSGHAAQPDNKDLYPALAAWRGGDPKAKLPPLKFFQDLAVTPKLERGRVAVDPNTQRVVNAVDNLCTKCHNSENDPKFDIYEYFPKIYHSGMKGK